MTIVFAIGSLLRIYIVNGGTPMALSVSLANFAADTSNGLKMSGVLHKHR